MLRPCLVVLSAFAAATVAGALPAQVQWQRFEYMPRTSGPLAYDALRDRFVTLTAPNGIGVPETWERDRLAGWLRRQPAVTPPWRGSHALAFDLLRGVTVWFSSGSSFPFGTAETYEWNGTTWTNVSPASQPPARSGHALAFDLANSRVVLFGGMSVNQNPAPLADTWEWTGTAWIQRIAPGPGARSNHALAYDLARGNVVLFGGQGVSGPFGDTWTYVNGAWTQRAGGPPARLGAAMAHDVARARTVLFGGGPFFGAYFDDTWEWDGSAWTQLSPATRPNGRLLAGMASDLVGGGVVLVGGSDTQAYADAWRWNGTTWTLVDDVPQPSVRHSHAMAFDDVRGELLVFGGVGPSTILGDFWRWNGTSWTGTAFPGPSGRTRAQMAFDSARGEAVLFGGELPGFTNQTWVWDGTTWGQRNPAVSPSARILHGMAYDRQRARVVLFGGVGIGTFGDTWEWDGTTWVQRIVAGPASRNGHGMAYDARAGVTLLHAGAAGFNVFSDTWQWDGTAWSQRQPATNPGPRREFAMAYDEGRERVVIFGDQASADAWEWDGTDWALRSVPQAPPARTRNALAFDSWRGHMLLFGGQSIGPNHADLWRYEPVVAATVTPFGSGCAGSAGVPQLTASRPWLGDTVPLVLGNGPASAVAALTLGLSNTIAGPFALPLPLAAFGMPGCTLLVSLDATLLAAAGASGVAALPFAIPNDAGLLGVVVHCQGAFFDPPANQAGVVTSAALSLRLGGR